MIGQAKGGDIQAASLLLSRVCPTLRPVQEPLKVDMPGDTITEKAVAILDAVSRGELSVMDGKALVDALAGAARIAALAETEGGGMYEIEGFDVVEVGSDLEPI